MRLLVDGDVLLRWLEGSLPLSDDATAEIRNSANVVYVSVATLWKLAIEQARGKLTVRGELRDHARQQLFDELPVLGDHVAAAQALPRHAGDEFDRMLVAQARCEGLVVVTADRRFAAYDVPLLFA